MVYKYKKKFDFLKCEWIFLFCAKNRLDIGMYFDF